MLLSLLANWPAGQKEHCAVPSWSEKDPALHAKHSVAPMLMVLAETKQLSVAKRRKRSRMRRLSSFTTTSLLLLIIILAYFCYG